MFCGFGSSCDRGVKCLANLLSILQAYPVDYILVLKVLNWETPRHFIKHQNKFMEQKCFLYKTTKVLPNDHSVKCPDMEMG